MSESFCSTSSVWSTQAASDRDLTSRPIEAALMTSSIARPIPRAARCDAIFGDCLPAGPVAGSFSEVSVCNRFCQTFVDCREQRVRRERLAQAERCAKFEGHSEKVGRGVVEARKGVAGHRDQRNLGRAFVEHPDRLKAAHMRHEDIDEHDVECRAFQRANPCLTAVGDGYFKALTLKTDLNGHAHHWIVIDHENTRHLPTSPIMNRAGIPMQPNQTSLSNLGRNASTRLHDRMHRSRAWFNAALTNCRLGEVKISGIGVTMASPI